MTDSGSDNILVEAVVEVRPSEDIEKVKTALSKVITGPIDIVETGQNRFNLRMRSNKRSSLDKLKMIIQRERIRNAARAVLYWHIEGETLEEFLKQKTQYIGRSSLYEKE